MPTSLLFRQLAQPLHCCSLLTATIAGYEQPLPSVDVVCIYRRRNATTVQRLLTDLPDARVRIWSLDEIDEHLADATVGVGKGTRTELINRLAIVDEERDASRWLLVADDDVRLPVGQLRLFVRMAQLAGLDVSQPAHLPRSYASWPFNRQRLSTLVRVTRFVEQGPLILFSPRARQECLPLPESLGMGWGVEAHFARAAQGGLRLGIVDAAGMRHLHPVAEGYDRSRAESSGRQALATAGYRSYGEMQVVTERWRFWARRPPWQ